MPRLAALLTAALLTAAPAFCQTPNPKVELGVQVGTIDERDSIGDKPVMLGGRATFKVWHIIDAETEVNRFPVGGYDATYPATQVLFGGRVGYRQGIFGLYAKARTGFLRYDKTNQPLQLGSRPMTELGATMEFYSRHHVAGRIDFGDAIVFYGTRPGYPIGTRHQFQGTFGVSAWF